MNIIISGKNIDVTPALRGQVEKKIGKLSKFFKPDTEAKVTLSVQKNKQIAEVTIFFEGSVIRAEESNGDMYASIDKIVDTLERQIGRNKTRLGKKLRESAFDATDFAAFGGNEEEQEYRIVKTKRFAIKPMSVEEAILQMNLLGHQFFMYLDAETEQPNVVYKRKDGDYGVIEPELK